MAANRARIRPNPCSRHAEPARRPGARRPHDSPATAASLVQPPVSPYNTTRRCNSPAGPGLGPHKTSSSKPASIWPTSTSAKSGQSRHPLIVTSRFISITRRRFHHDNHSSVLTGARPATFSGSLPLFNPSTRSPRFTHSPPISPSVCFPHTLISLFTVHPRTGPQPGRPVHSDTVYTAALTRTHDALALHHGTGPALSSHL